MKTTTLKTMTKKEARSFLEEKESWRLYAAGISLLKKNNLSEAILAFEEALEHDPDDPHCRSYLGLAMSMEGRKGREAVELCEAAAKADPYNSELLHNLVKVYMACNKRRKAHGVLSRARRIDARHTGLMDTMKTMGSRRPPVLGFLPRGHALNRTLGKVLSSFRLR